MKKTSAAGATVAATVNPKTTLQMQSVGPDSLMDQATYNQALLIVRAGIASDDEWSQCSDVIDTLKENRKNMEISRVKKVTPFNEIVNSFNTYFKSKFKDLDEVCEKLNDIYVDYNNKREARIRKAAEEEEARQAKEAEEAAKKAAEEQEKIAAEKAEEAKVIAEHDPFDDEPESEPVLPLETSLPSPPLPTLSNQSPGPMPPTSVPPGTHPFKPTPPPPKAPEPKKSTILTTWYAIIEDPDKVPVEYKVPSEKLIMNAFDKGIREIPGVRFDCRQTVKKSRQ